MFIFTICSWITDAEAIDSVLQSSSNAQNSSLIYINQMFPWQTKFLEEKTEVAMYFMSEMKDDLNMLRECSISHRRQTYTLSAAAFFYLAELCWGLGDPWQRR